MSQMLYIGSYLIGINKMTIIDKEVRKLQMLLPLRLPDYSTDSVSLCLHCCIATMPLAPMHPHVITLPHLEMFSVYKGFMSMDWQSPQHLHEGRTVLPTSQRRKQRLRETW